MKGRIFYENDEPVAVESWNPSAIDDRNIDSIVSELRSDPEVWAAVQEQIAEGVRTTLKLIVGSPNPGLQAEVLSLLLGVGFRGCTEAEIAKKNNVTRAAVCARMIKARAQIGITRPVGPMRADSTREECVRSRYLASMH